MNLREDPRQGQENGGAEKRVQVGARVEIGPTLH
jgi:hypothetical protein